MTWQTFRKRKKSIYKLLEEEAVIIISQKDIKLTPKSYKLLGRVLRTLPCSLMEKEQSGLDPLRQKIQMLLKSKVREKTSLKCLPKLS